MAEQAPRTPRIQPQTSSWEMVPQAILGILLTTAVTGTAEAALLCLILFLQLRRKVKTDKGAQRLQKRRSQARTQSLS